MLRCAAGKPEIIVEWSFKAAGKANLVVEYRFDGKPGRGLQASYVNRSKQRSGDLTDVRAFLRDARASAQVYVRVTSDAFGFSEAEFSATAGADMANRFVTACPTAGS